jgi:hypothetical protein
MKVYHNGVEINGRARRMPDLIVGDRARLLGRGYRGQHGTVAIGKSGNVLTKKGVYVCLDVDRDQGKNKTHWFNFSNVRKIEESSTFDQIDNGDEGMDTADNNRRVRAISPTAGEVSLTASRREEMLRIISDISFLQDKLKELIIQDDP